MDAMEEVFGHEFVFDDLNLTVIAEETSTKKAKVILPEILDRSLSEQVELAVNDATQSDLAKLTLSMADYTRYDLEFNLIPGDHPNKHEVEKRALKGITKVKTALGMLVLPIYKTAAALEQLSRLVEQVDITMDELDAIRALLYSTTIDVKAVHANAKWKATCIIKDQTKLANTKQEIAITALTLEFINGYKNQLCCRVAAEYSHLKTKVDIDNEGLWVHLKPQSKLPMKRKPLTQCFKFSAKHVSLLHDITFAPDTLKSAKAKLDIQQSLEGKIAAETLANPKHTLAKCLFAAGLTHIEIMAVVFAMEARETDYYECLRCQKSINIDTVVYHGKCEVVEWI